MRAPHVRYHLLQVGMAEHGPGGAAEGTKMSLVKTRGASENPKGNLERQEAAKKRVDGHVSVGALWRSRDASQSPFQSADLP